MKYSETQLNTRSFCSSRHTFRCLTAALGIMGLAACDSSADFQVLSPPSSSNNTETMIPFTEAAETAEAATQEVAFELDFSAQFQDKNSIIANDVKEISALSPGIMTGFMLIENMNTGETESRPWSIQVDGANFPGAVSLTTTPLKEGEYTFTLSVVRDDNQYIGTVFHVVDEDTLNDIPMVIRPVIGDSLVDVTVTDSLIDFGFSYPAAELSAAGLLDPTIRISIDGGPPQFFLLDPNTGISEDVLLIGLPPGEYNFSMELFANGYLLGKTPQQQETITVSPGLDILMDIAPTFGEVIFSPITENADAPIEVVVPAAVVDEAGGLSNLAAILRVVGTETPFYEFPLSLTPNGADYSASVVIPEMSFNELTYEMLFINIASSEIIGSCIDTQAIDTFGGTVNCPLVLKRESTVTGNLLSTLGLNVYDIDGNPLPGAVVRINGADAGITGSSGTFNSGYIQLDVKPGTQTISAEFGPESGELIYDSIPLNVTSLNLSMGQTINTAPTLLSDEFNGTQTGSVAPVNYWFGCNGSGVPEFSHFDNGKLELWSHSNDPGVDFCSGTSAVTDYSFNDTEITDAGGFQVSVDIAWSDDPTSSLAIGIGEELGNDPFNFDPIPTLDAIVDIYESVIVVRIFDYGTIESVSSYPMPLATSELENVTIDVQTSSFAPGAPATLAVYINGDSSFVPATYFTWDGGSNHIEIRGGGTAEDPGMVALDKLTVSPR